MPRKPKTTISPNSTSGSPGVAPPAAQSAPLPDSERNKLFRALARHFIVKALDQNEETKPSPADAARLAKTAAELQSLAAVSDYLIADPAAEEVERQLVQALFDASTGIKPAVSVPAAKFLLCNLFPARWSLLPQPGAAPAPHTSDAPSSLPPFRLRLAN